MSGQVLERPTGSEAIAWILYAESIERERKLRKKLEKKHEKTSNRDLDITGP